MRGMSKSWLLHQICVIAGNDTAGKDSRDYVDRDFVDKNDVWGMWAGILLTRMMYGVLSNIVHL